MKKMNSEDVLTDQSVSNAKIEELEEKLREMKKKLDEVAADA